MYSEAEGHLANLDHCGGRALRRAYLTLLLAAERAGYHTGPKDAVRELMIRDAAGRQHFGVVVEVASLLFSVRRPALADTPTLGAQAALRFAGRVEGDPNSMSEIRIRVANASDAEDIADWVFAAGNFSPGYGEHRSA